MNVRGRFKLAIALLGASVLVVPLAASQATAGPQLSRVSQDTIVDGLGFHQTEVQPTLAAAEGTKMMAGAFEVGRQFSAGSSAIGFANSQNGGGNWKNGLLKLTVQSGQATTPLGPLWRAADPSIAFDARDHKFLISATGMNGTGGIVGLFVSGAAAPGDRGQGNVAWTWSAPVVVHAAATGDSPENGSIACDNTPVSPSYGTCYVAYDNAGASNRIQVVTSTDGGATWSAPVATSDTATGTSSVAVVQPGTNVAPGRLVVAYTGGGGVSWTTSSDAGATLAAHTQVLPASSTATHTVAQGLRTSLVTSASVNKTGAVYLVWQTRGFRLQQTTLSAAVTAPATHITTANVTGLALGQTITVDAAGANPETVTITTAPTTAAAGLDVSPALQFNHNSGAFVTKNAVLNNATGDPNDIGLSVMPDSSSGFGTPVRIPIEADAGATSNTNDHFMPAIAADPTTTGSGTHLGLFYYKYPLAACQYVNTTANQCSPEVGFVSSTNNGGSWSAPQALSTGPPSIAVFPRTGTGNGSPDVGNVLAAAVSPGTTATVGKAFGFFPVGAAVNGFNVSMFTPDGGLTP